MKVCVYGVDTVLVPKHFGFHSSIFQLGSLTFAVDGSGKVQWKTDESVPDSVLSNMVWAWVNL